VTKPSPGTVLLVFDSANAVLWAEEVADDVGLGLLLHRTKAKSRALASVEDVRLHWYDSIGQMFGGLEKNLFGPGAHYSVARLAAIVVFSGCLAAAEPAPVEA